MYHIVANHEVGVCHIVAYHDRNVIGKQIDSSPQKVSLTYLSVELFVYIAFEVSYYYIELLIAHLKKQAGAYLTVVELSVYMAFEVSYN